MPVQMDAAQITAFLKKVFHQVAEDFQVYCAAGLPITGISTIVTC